MTHYDTLGVEKTSTAAEIKKGFKKKVREVHPDKNPDDPLAHDNLKKVNAAYDVLGDPEKRQVYDQWGDDGPNTSNGRSQHSRRYTYADGFGDSDDLFRSWSSRSRANTNHKPNIRQSIRVPLNVMIDGGSVTGAITAPTIINGHQVFGAGKKHTITFDVPPKTPLGQFINIPDHGIEGVGTVRLMIDPILPPDVHFENGNLVIPLEVDVFDAMFGKSVFVDLPTGRRIKVDIPEGMPSHQILRVAEHGVYLGKDHRGVERRGDVMMAVMLTGRVLDEEQKDKIFEILYPESS